MKMSRAVGKAECTAKVVALGDEVATTCVVSETVGSTTNVKASTETQVFKVVEEDSELESDKLPQSTQNKDSVEAQEVDMLKVNVSPCNGSQLEPEARDTNLPEVVEQEQLAREGSCDDLELFPDMVMSSDSDEFVHEVDDDVTEKSESRGNAENEEKVKEQEEDPDMFPEIVL